MAVLRLMGLFDRPADAGCLAALRRETIPGLTEPLAGLDGPDWEYCLSGLETAKLLTVNRAPGDPRVTRLGEGLASCTRSAGAKQDGANLALCHPR